MSTPPRASPPLQARPLVMHHLLSRSATDLTTADHQCPSVSLAPPETLASPSLSPPCDAHGEERTHTVRSGSDGGVPLRSHQIRAGRRTGPAWLSPAAPARLFFFRLIVLLICKSLQSLKFHKNESVHPKNGDSNFPVFLVMLSSHWYCMFDF
jgi:hypothetical protein